eukprot:2644225-Rhodomonas_salina.2
MLSAVCSSTLSSSDLSSQCYLCQCYLCSMLFALKLNPTRAAFAPFAACFERVKPPFEVLHKALRYLRRVPALGSWA